MKLTKILSLLLSFTVLFCYSCGKDEEPEPQFNDISLKCEQTYTIKNGSDVNWTSSNKYIASVSGNVVTAERIGEAVISSSKGSFKVTVSGNTMQVYTIPCIEWGVTKTTVKNFMKNSGSTLDEETSTELTYTGTGAQILTSYTFENSGLVSSGVGLNGDYIDSEDLIDFMMERYIPVSMDEDNYAFYFVTPDNKTALGLYLKAYGSTLAYIIVYIPRSDNSRSVFMFDCSRFEEFGFYNSSVLKNKYEEIKAKF